MDLPEPFASVGVNMRTNFTGLPSLIIPKDGLIDRQSIMNQLIDLFPDRCPFLTSETGIDWKFELRCWEDKRWYVDPQVFSVAKKLWGLDSNGISSFYQIEYLGEIDFVFSLFHSWALVAAVHATQRYNYIPFSYVIHIDAHNDLMPLALSRSGISPQVDDTIFSVAVNLLDPLSIIDAINRGIISKGNFLTAYVLGAPSCKVIHVKEDVVAKELWLSEKNALFSLSQMVFKGTELAIQHQPTVSGWRFRQVNRLPQNLPTYPETRVWVDIDLDAFCNRYDGDSDRSNLLGNSYEKYSMLEKIDRFLDQLSKASWLSFVKAVSVAASPGFFPSEYWEYAVPKVQQGVRELVCKM